MMHGMRLAVVFLLLNAGRAMPSDRPPIIGLSHVGFMVMDMQKSRIFYRDVLGYEEPFRPVKGASGSETVYYKINDRQYVELRGGLKPDQEDTWVHLAFETADAEAMRLFLSEKGVTVPDQIFPDRLGNLSFTVQDFAGRPLEFVQYLPGSLLMRSKGKAVPARRLSGRMFHAGMPVTDLEQANRFYRDILGFSEMLRSHTDRPPNWINYKVPEAGVYIEWTLLDKNTDRRKLSLRHHMGLAVFDVQAAVETLREREAAAGQTVEGFPNVGFNNRWQVGAFDPDGRRHELMEPYTMR
jgi:catechol 2,3-dioxygenase-like lactoylglutathione lyase family enzyme